MFAIGPKQPRPQQQGNGGAILGGAMLVACLVNALGNAIGFGFVGAGYLLSGLLAAGGLIYVLAKITEGDRDLWWHPFSAWPIAAAIVWWSTFSGFNYMAIQTNPTLFGDAGGLTDGSMARFLPFYATLWFKAGGFALIAAVRLVQHALEKKYQY
jgi:hypothetical protein